MNQNYARSSGHSPPEIHVVVENRIILLRCWITKLNGKVCTPFLHTGILQQPLPSALHSELCRSELHKRHFARHTKADLHSAWKLVFFSSFNDGSLSSSQWTRDGIVENRWNGQKERQILLNPMLGLFKTVSAHGWLKQIDSVWRTRSQTNGISVALCTNLLRIGHDGNEETCQLMCKGF